jgi:hypothetical protein
VRWGSRGKNRCMHVLSGCSGRRPHLQLFSRQSELAACLPLPQATTILPASALALQSARPTQFLLPSFPSFRTPIVPALTLSCI